MPGTKFTKKADTPRRERMWDEVYRSTLERGATEAGAIRQANGAVKKDKEKKRSTKMKRGPVSLGFRG